VGGGTEELIIQETKEDIQKAPSHHTPSTVCSILGHAGDWVYAHASSSRKMADDFGVYT
jgi:hypothetical protein